MTLKVRILQFSTTFTQVYTRPKINLLGSSLAFTLKEGSVRCAKVCNKSWVILLYLSYITLRIYRNQNKNHCNFNVQFTNLTKRGNEHPHALEILKKISISLAFIQLYNHWLAYDKQQIWYVSSKSTEKAEPTKMTSPIFPRHVEYVSRDNVLPEKWRKEIIKIP